MKKVLQTPKLGCVQNLHFNFYLNLFSNTIIFILIQAYCLDFEVGDNLVQSHVLITCKHRSGSE
jgi:hypothetical protein